jgi:hypothetical protein
MHDALTNGPRIWHARLSRLKPKDPTIPGRNAYTPAHIRAEAKRRPIHREKRALTARRATGAVCSRPRIARAAPERVGALKGEKRLRDVRLGEYYGACCAELRDDLCSTYTYTGARAGKEVCVRDV